MNRSSKYEVFKGIPKTSNDFPGSTWPSFSPMPIFTSISQWKPQSSQTSRYLGNGVWMAALGIYPPFWWHSMSHIYIIYIISLYLDYIYYISRFFIISLIIIITIIIISIIIIILIYILHGSFTPFFSLHRPASRSWPWTIKIWRSWSRWSPVCCSCRLTTRRRRLEMTGDVVVFSVGKTCFLWLNRYRYSHNVTI